MNGRDTLVTARPTTLDGEYSALFASMWSVTPTFHRYGREARKRTEREGVTADYTACGLLVSSYDRNTGKLRESMSYVPMRHALAFGRPCRKCFPDA